jgi:sodium-dependent dicarboxylate transporter 2/3/5
MSFSFKTMTARTRSLVYFLLSFTIALVLTLLIKEPSFTTTQVYTLFLLFFAIGLWFTEAIPAFSVSIFIIAYLVFMLGNKNFNDNPENIEKYVATFSGSVIWLLLGGFFLATAMTKTKLDEALFRLTLKISGSHPKSLLIGLMTTTMVASMFMSNAAATAMMVASIMPLLKSLDEKPGLAKALLLGVPIAATTGGMASVIGSPPNLIAVGALENIGITVSFLDWMIYGLPVALVLTAISCIVLMRLYVKDNIPVSLAFMQTQEQETSREEKIQRVIVLIVITVTILLWLTPSVHSLKAGAVSAVPLVFLTLTGVLTSKDVKGLPWDTLLLVAGGLSLGKALYNSGLLEHYAFQLRNIQVSQITLIFILAYVTMALSNVMSHTATSTILIPFAMALLIGFEKPVAIIIGLASSTALFLPVSTPPNAIAYSTGYLKIADFWIGGFVIGLLGPLLAIIWLLLLT